MSRLSSSSSLLLSLALALVVFPTFCHAFGAGNIAGVSKVEGVNWRHGDIEDTLLTILMSRAAGGKKFSKMDVKRVYFGNWLRDYSQAVDVGTVKSVSAEAIRIILWVLGFLSFGYGTREFEVTRDRLGCYRPEEHIDNPKDYADNIDARQYDRRLRGPVDERRELAIDPQTGLKTYIASEQAGITTSAGLVRDLFNRSIQLGRQYSRSKRDDDLFEALRLLGTACHCLEDYSAHSNYVELCLLEMGERDIFPHVGRNCMLQLPGARNRVFPIITGTFGGVDFLHSVMGEFSDKATQSEMQELEGAISDSESQGNVSIVKELLDKLPSGLIGGDQSGKADELQANSAAAKMNNMHISPREPEAFTRQIGELTKQIYPILEFHDEILKGVTETIEKIPVLPALIEQLQDQINIFVFSLLAPFVLPIIRQVKTELSTGSSEIIQSSRDKQLNTFYNDNEDNPTHSMLSKDHFSNVLNEPAGKVASSVLKWAVPQIIACWDDERVDPNRTINRIVTGVFHHPSLRQYGDDGAVDGRMTMFQTVEQWWQSKSDTERNGLRDQLSRDGVQNGRNHKEGVHDSGHGCGKPIALKGMAGSGSSAGILGDIAGSVGGGASHSGGAGGQVMQQVGSVASDAVGGGALGGIVGGLVGGVGASLLGNAFGGSGDEHKTYASAGHSSSQSGTYSSSITETAHHRPQYQGDEERYGQAEYKRTSYQSGGERQEYSRYEQDGSSGQVGYGFQQSVEQQPRYGGGYEQTTETRYERPGGEYESHVQRDRYDSDGRRESREYKSKHSHHKHGSDDDDSNDSGSNDEDDYEKKQRKREKKERKEREKREKEERKRQQDADSYGDYNRENQLRGSGGYGRGGEEYSGGYEERGGGYQQESRGGYGGGGGYEQESRGGYGGGGGGGGYEQEQRGGYGGGYEQEQRGGYGGNDYEQEQRGGGYGGGYGGGDEYGERREYGDNDNYGERRGYGDDY